MTTNLTIELDQVVPDNIVDFITQYYPDGSLDMVLDPYGNNIRKISINETSDNVKILMQILYLDTNPNMTSSSSSDYTFYINKHGKQLFIEEGYNNCRWFIKHNYTKVNTDDDMMNNIR